MNSARFFVTGTDTDVGKTRVCAALAVALRLALPLDVPLTVVKPVQTGVRPDEPGDADCAVNEARTCLSPERSRMVAARELRRYRKPADAFSAALAEDLVPPSPEELAAEIARMPGAVVVEGFGGAAAPLNEASTIGQIAAAASLRTIIAIGLRLGCISHALLTLRYLQSIGADVAGAVLVDRWHESSGEYREDVERCLTPHLRILAAMPHDRSGTALTIVAQELREWYAPAATASPQRG